MTSDYEPKFWPLAYFDGDYIPFHSAKLSIATHALQYGTAALAGIRGRPNPLNPNQILVFRLDRHCQRLSQSAQLLGFSFPSPEIESILRDLIRQCCPIEPFYIRPLTYASALGISPRLHDVNPQLLMYGMTLGEILPATGIRCRISSWMRPSDRSMPLRAKLTSSYINSALGKTEAVASGFDETIFLNDQGKVCEASGMNIFLVRSGVLITPQVNQDILEGITRDSLIAIANALNIPVQERAVDRSELLLADEVFLCGTAAQLVPVQQIENYRLPQSHPITDALKASMEEIVEGKSDRFQEWISIVECPDIMG